MYIMQFTRYRGIVAYQFPGLPWDGGQPIEEGRRPVQVEAGYHRQHHSVREGKIVGQREHSKIVNYIAIIPLGHADEMR